MPVLLLLLTAVLAFGGTVSPQLGSMPPGQPVQVIVQYLPSLIGSALPQTVCPTAQLIQLLPIGEWCSTNAAAASGMAQNPASM
jgi:hypothetical protein